MSFTPPPRGFYNLPGPVRRAFLVAVFISVLHRLSHTQKLEWRLIKYLWRIEMSFYKSPYSEEQHAN